VLHVCQHRLREKTFLRDAGCHCRFVRWDSEASLRRAVEQLGTPCVLKTASFGYDGKGQRKLDDIATSRRVGGVPRNARGAGGVGALRARDQRDRRAGIDGRMVSIRSAKNRHARHILDLTLVPADLDPEVAGSARVIAGEVARSSTSSVARALRCFLLEGTAHSYQTNSAARPHNSGHFSFDALQSPRSSSSNHPRRLRWPLARRKCCARARWRISSAISGRKGNQLVRSPSHSPT
jgi:5-(carboxyamino)imidazole ribonucleotide synthase